jgi:pilus assembly protein Flp/PilA
MQPARALRRATNRSERGASLVEYALLVALIAVVSIVAVTFVGTSGSAKLTEGGAGIGGTGGGGSSVTTTTGMPTSAFECVQNPDYMWINGRCVRA